MHGVALHRPSLLMDASVCCLASDVDRSICKRKVGDERLVLVHATITHGGHSR